MKRRRKLPVIIFDGRNVTQHTYDILSLEYPTQVSEPCYQRSEPISPGWHTVKVTYQDTSGNRYEYKWRFQIIDEEGAWNTSIGVRYVRV